MQLKKVNNHFSVSPQISGEDVIAIKEAGFKSIICNRPNGESDDQPAYETIKKIAEEQGLTFAFLPVVGGQISDVDVSQFDSLLNDLPSPVAAYCRTGTRCITLWALTNANKMKTDDIISTAKNAGYDLSGLAGRLN